MKLACLLPVLLVFTNIYHIGGDGIRAPLSIYEKRNGEDIDYYGTISIGTPPQTFNVKFYFGWSAIYVLSNYCNSSVCLDQNHKTYNHKTSKTSQYGHDFDTKIQKISPGVPVSDTITIGNMKIRNVSFLSTTVSSLFSSKPYDGIVGLQYNSSLLYHCKKLGLKTTFSLYTDYPWDNNTSELMLCGEDKTKFQGNLQYVGLSSRQDNGWNIAMQSILLHHNDKSVPIMEFQGSFELTPSSSYITGPEEFIEKIYKALNATTSKISNIKEVDCKTIHTLPSISFRTADQDYFTLTGNDYITQLTQNDQRVCMVRLISHVTNSWIIGNVFTRKFYTVFDLEVDRIGFAESIHDNVRNSASTVIIINNVILIIVPIFFMIY